MLRIHGASLVLVLAVLSGGGDCLRRGGAASSLFARPVPSSDCVKAVKEMREDSSKTCEEMDWRMPRCDFLKKAFDLSFGEESPLPSSSKAEEETAAFCVKIDEALFCAGIMEELMMAGTTGDLAVGICARRGGSKDYCMEVGKMMRTAVGKVKPDLDPLNACYQTITYGVHLVRSEGGDEANTHEVKSDEMASPFGRLGGFSREKAQQPTTAPHSTEEASTAAPQSTDEASTAASTEEAEASTTESVQGDDSGGSDDQIVLTTEKPATTTTSPVDKIRITGDSEQERSTSGGDQENENAHGQRPAKNEGNDTPSPPPAGTIVTSPTAATALGSIGRSIRRADGGSAAAFLTKFVVDKV